MGFIFMIMYFMIISLVIEIAIILFRLTGLDRKIARFQVISMLTGTGFTNDESDSILNHPMRRKITMFLILFGAFSMAVIISSISSILSDDLRLTELTFIITTLLVIFMVMNLPFFRNKMTNALKSEMETHYELCEHPIQEVMFWEDTDTVMEIGIQEDSDLIDKNAGELLKKGQDIQLLFIQSGEVKIRKGIDEYDIQMGDQLFLYGNREEIEEMFKKDMELSKKTVENKESDRD